jgi:hypothetical protein
MQLFGETVGIRAQGMKNSKSKNNRGSFDSLR